MDEKEKLEELEETETDEETTGNDDHPLDVLNGAIEDVKSQIKRLRGGVIPHNLHGELQNNIYPILLNALVSIWEFGCLLEDEIDEMKGEEQPDKQLGDEIESASKEIIDVCDRINKVKDKIPKELMNEFGPIGSWAEKVSTLSALNTKKEGESHAESAGDKK